MIFAVSFAKFFVIQVFMSGEVGLPPMNFFVVVPFAKRPAEEAIVPRPVSDGGNARQERLREAVGFALQGDGVDGFDLRLFARDPG